MPTFPPTRHSLLVAVRAGAEPERRQALETVAAAYWRPAYLYLRLQWHLPPATAEDETQEFFAHVLERGLLERYDPARARFRSYLRLLLDGFAANRREARRRHKRGGAVIHVPLDAAVAEREVTALATGAGDDPEALFTAAWTRSVVELALGDLERSLTGSGRGRRYEVFRRYDLAEPAARPSYAALAGELGIPVTTVTNELAAARRELRRLLVERLRGLTASDEELRAEATLLLGAPP